MKDKVNVKKYVTWIANHKDPSNIGGCKSCPSNDSLKLEFGTGWTIVYQVVKYKVCFLGFYRDLHNHLNGKN